MSNADNFTRTFGYAIEDERGDEIDANGQDPDHVLLSCRAAYPQFNAYANPFSRLTNQRAIGSCQGVSLGHITQIECVQQFSQHVRFSGMQAYVESQNIDGIRGDRGSTLAAGQKVAATIGIVREKDWPYPDRYSTQPPPGYEQAPRVFINSSKRVKDADLIWDLLAASSAIHMGVSWGRCFEANICTQWRRPVSGGHAVLLYGLVEGSDNAWLHNSWGPGFGVNGRVQVTKEFIKQTIRNDRYATFVAYDPTGIELSGDVFEMVGPVA